MLGGVPGESWVSNFLSRGWMLIDSLADYRHQKIQKRVSIFLEGERSMASKSPSVGDAVKLRKDALPGVTAREWTVLGKNNDRVILIRYTAKGRALEVVKENDIDWEKYPRKDMS